MDGWGRERLRVRDIGVVTINRLTDGAERRSESEISELLESAGGRMEQREAQSQRYRSCYNQQVDGWGRERLKVRDIGVVRISRWTDGAERRSESEISELLESAGGRME